MATHAHFDSFDSVAKSVVLLAADGDFAASRLQAMARYADAMGWSYRVCKPAQLAEALRGWRIDLVLCWRFGDILDVEDLVTACHRRGVSVLALAQSCSALAE